MNRTFAYALFFFACTILSINAARSIAQSYNVGTVYRQRKLETQKQYLELVKKKNELDYINSPFFIEKQLRESLKYYRQGEKLLVFTKPVDLPQTQQAAIEKAETPALTQWLKLITDGIVSTY